MAKKRHTKAGMLSSTQPGNQAEAGACVESGERCCCSTHLHGVPEVPTETPNPHLSPHLAQLCSMPPAHVIWEVVKAE